ncbi:SGNH/GDSL hydrolase family protein [Algoriphagus kandeliae]|uniref:SGNH/GDSL hydrolase family protein n=1 Tax=Algoriphagus kandeliae TaxID=2562278 RepID=A0A4Y9QZ64_9BACT|nr:SGNH/GDSL hydrolase family protein [Algoriphagus kandeliae]TFV97417.1 SGNH/GDSL hydrolase family protein [Algoriphagus kandeliae]
MKIKIASFVLAFFLLDFSIGKFLEQGLFRYYGLRTDSKIAFVGHSHLMLGLDKKAIEDELKIPVSKYTREGVNVAERDLMIDQLSEENPELEIVVYGVDAWMFTGEGLSANSYKLFYPFLDQEAPAAYVKKEAEFLDYWQHKLIKTSRYNEGLISSSFRGYLNNWDNLKFGVVDTLQLKLNVESGNFRQINSSEENRRIFEETLQKLKEMGKRVILVYVPTISYYNHAEPEKFRKELNYFRSLADKDSNIDYLEYLEGWEDQFNYFFDPIHLNPVGQKAFTSSFATDLKKILQDGTS